MLKKLLAATAMVTIATAAYAAQPVNKTNTTAAAPAGQMFMPAVGGGDHLATKLIGATVYNSDAEDAQAIGKVHDLVVADNGGIDAVVVGVGGFLGIGEKNVALNFSSLKWSDRDGSIVLIATTTKDELQGAPAFDEAALEPGQVPAGQTMQAPADQMAAQPAPAAGTRAPIPNAADLQQVDVATISANDLINTTVYSGNNENVGEVGDVILSDAGKIDAVVLDVGGFLGLGEKPVAIAFDALDIRKDAKGGLYLYTSFSKDQLDAAPKYEKDAYAKQRDTMRLANPS